MSSLPERANEHQTISTPSGEIISIRAYREIHDQIVKSSQKINKQFFDNLLLDINNINNIYYKLVQLSHQENYDNVVDDTKITIVRVGDETQSFLSFEDFEKNAISQDNATTQIIIEYSFCLRNSLNYETRRYEINITINSKLGIAKELSKSNKVPKNFQNNILKMIPTVEFTMKYSDYLTTVSFVKAIEEWVNTCDSTDSTWDKIINNAQDVSHYFHIFSKMLLVIFILIWFNSYLINILIIKNNVDLLINVVNFSGYLIIMFLLAHLFGKKIETLVDSYRSISYINFNAADKKIIKVAQPQRIKKLTAHIFGLIINIMTSLIASLIFIQYF